MDYKHLLILGSSVLILLSGLPYIRDIVRKKTKPKIVTWLNWSLLSWITGFASLSDKQYAAAILSFTAGFLCSFIAILAIRHGSRKYESLDVICQIGIIATLIIWYFSKSAAAAIVLAIIIDLLAFIPTIVHSWKKPFEETWELFFINGIADFLTLLAAESVRITSVANPSYLLLADFGAAAIIIYRRQKVRLAK